MISPTSSRVADPAVVNASPLIVLSKAGYLDLLKLEGETVLVPDVVGNEIRAHLPDVATHVLDAAHWLKIVQTPVVHPTIQAWDLGGGESAVLTWAYSHSGTVAIIDDLAARRCARSLKIPLRGSLGLVLLARRRGVIPAARPVVEKLLDAGLYLAKDVVDRSLALVGE